MPDTARKHSTLCRNMAGARPAPLSACDRHDKTKISKKPASFCLPNPLPTVWCPGSRAPQATWANFWLPAEIETPAGACLPQGILIPSPCDGTGIPLPTMGHDGIALFPALARNHRLTRVDVWSTWSTPKLRLTRSVCISNCDKIIPRHCSWPPRCALNVPVVYCCRRPVWKPARPNWPVTRSGSGRPPMVRRRPMKAAPRDAKRSPITKRSACPDPVAACSGMFPPTR